MQPGKPPDDADFNPRSPWGERRCSSLWTLFPQVISIHAPRGGSDPILQDILSMEKFQSTLPVGGATVLTVPLISTGFDFNPRSPWGERPLSANAVHII